MFTKTFFALRISCISVLILGAVCVRAQDLISARVLSIEGQVEIQRLPADQPQVQKIAFKISDELKAGDTIITGRADSLLQRRAGCDRHMVRSVALGGDVEHALPAARRLQHARQYGHRGD